MIFSASTSCKKDPVDNELEAVHLTCRTCAITYTFGRLKSSGAVRKRLQTENFPSQVIENVIEELKQEGYIQDLALALAIIKERRGRKAEGYPAIRQRMSSFGIPRQIIDEAMKTAVDEDVLIAEFLTTRQQELLTAWAQEESSVDKQQILTKLVRKANARGFRDTLVLDYLKTYISE